MNNMVQSIFNALPRTFNRLNAGFEKFDELALKVKNLPVTMQISGLRMNGTFTIHSLTNVTLLKCLTNLSEVVYLSEDNEASLLVVEFCFSDICCNTLEELRKKKKDLAIEYFVCTKNFNVDNEYYYEAGQVFKFAPQKLGVSFKSDKKRGIHVLVYPEMNKVLFPLDAEGNFRKCLEPSNMSLKSLFFLKYPFYITISNEKNKAMQQVREKTLLVIEKVSHSCYFASTRYFGELSIHAFTSSQCTIAKILDDSLTVDKLDENELKIVLNSFFIPRDERIAKFHCVRTYQELGISRLSEEIRTELKNTLFTTSSPDYQSIFKENIFENSYESLRKTMKNAPVKHSPNFKCEPSQYNSFKMSKKRESLHTSRKPSNMYVNDSPHTDEIKLLKNRELIVELDTGGYVIMPITKKLTSIGFDGESLYYKSCENQGYVSSNSMEYPNKNRLTNVKNNNEQHEYSYISLDNKHNDQISNHSILNQSFESNAECSKAIDVTYDYPYSGYLSLKQYLTSQNEYKKVLESMSVSEVCGLLRLLSMRNLVESFQKFSINGRKLVLLHEKDFIAMNTTKFEARKLYFYINGWRPCNKENGLGTWLTKSPKQWSVSELSQYLLHVNMRSLVRFVTRHHVDGYLLNEILKDEVIFSLIPEHNVLLKQQDIEKLKKYFDENDDFPKFELLR